MSGGSMNYLYQKIERTIEKDSYKHREGFKQNTALRKQFAKHLQKVANALKEIEWCDSGDSGEEEVEIAIKECLLKED